MINKRRGEIEAMIGGRKRRMCLTLGSLAELESEFKVDNIATLIDQLNPEQLSSETVLKLLEAGLRGAGEDDDIDLQNLGLHESVGEILRVAYSLLEATFGIVTIPQEEGQEPLVETISTAPS